MFALEWIRDASSRRPPSRLLAFDDRRRGLRRS